MSASRKARCDTQAVSGWWQAAPGQGELPGGAARSPNTETGKPAKEVPPPFRFNGRFAFDHQRLGADEFRFETGPLEDPYTADGSAFVELARNQTSQSTHMARRFASTKRSVPAKQ